MHRKVFDEYRMPIRDRIEIGADQRRVSVEFRLISPRDQPPSIGGQLRNRALQPFDDGLFGLRSLVRCPIGGGPIEPAHIRALPQHAGNLQMHVRFDEARDDHAILKAPVDLEFLVGDPAADLVQRPHREDLAAHHRHGCSGRRPGIESDDRLRRVDRDLLRGRTCRRRGGRRNERVDPARFACKLVMGAGPCGRRHHSRDKKK
jgi:hypothetical protein